MTPFYATYRQDPQFKFKPQPKINTTGLIIKQIQCNGTSLVTVKMS